MNTKHHPLKRLRSKLAVSITAIFLVVLLVFAGLTTAISFVQFSGAFLEHYTSTAYRIADLACFMVKGDEIMRYDDPEYMATEEYDLTLRRLNNITQFLDASFIYVIIPSDDYHHITFMLSTVNEDLAYDTFPVGCVRETSSEEYAMKYKLIMDGESERESVYRDDKETGTGDHITAMVPVKDSDGNVVAILCVQRQLSSLEAVQNRYLINILVATFLTLLLAVLLFTYILSRRVANPIRNIASETVRFSRENTLPDTSLTSTTKGENEIKLLAMHVDKMEYAIMDYTNNLKNLRSERERVESELNVASSIQLGILPSTFPAFPGRDEFDIYATMVTAREVGGDFYDFFFIDDDHLALVMADVSGKGVPAALFMMVSKIVIKNRALRGGSPGEILEDVNKSLMEGNFTDMFVTAWLGILNVTTGELDTANAGHEYPAICRKNGRFELFRDKHNFVLAGVSGTRYEEAHLVLEPGDSLFVYTDGVVEAENSDESFYGTGRMLDALNEVSTGTPQELVDHVMDSVKEYAGDYEQFDDITTLALTFKGSKTHLRTLRLEAGLENLDRVNEWVEETLAPLDIPPKENTELLLAVEELYVNIARYAYAPGKGFVRIRMGYDKETDTVIATFMDSGVPYDPLKRADPNIQLSAKDREVGGLGIYLVKQTMDKVSYYRSQTLNVLTIEKHIERDGDAADSEQ